MAEDAEMGTTGQANNGFGGLKESLIGDNGFLSNVNKSLDTLMDNNITKTAIIIFLVLYAAFAAPNLPDDIKKLLKNRQSGTIIRIVFAFVIILLAGNVKTLSLALLLAIGFVISLQNLEDSSTDLKMSSSTGANWTAPDTPKVTETKVPEPPQSPNTQDPTEKVEPTIDLETENFAAFEKLEHFAMRGAPFKPVDSGSNNKPRHLPFHSVTQNNQGDNVVQEEGGGDTNGDGIYSDDNTQATNSLLTYNLKQDSFTDNTQLNSVQSNNVPEADQNTGIQTMNPQQGPQGLNQPMGYNY